MSRPLVRVVGFALTSAALGCGSGPKTPPVTGNPPAPTPPDAPAPIPEVPGTDVATNLPSWDSVASGHPVGATNPPYPVLYVSKDDGGCHKGWMGGMVPPPPDIAAADGRVVATAADVPEGTTRVACPPGEPARLLAAYAALPAGTPTTSPGRR